jgi:glycosyltransferase involved in cell wall biosynthesis
LGDIGLKIAVVHDWFPAFRGGERVVSEICKVYPEADVFTLLDFMTDEEHRAHFEGIKFQTSPVDRWPLIEKYYKHIFALYPFFMEQIDVTGYDAVISSSAAYARGVITGPEQPHLCYVHSPMRYVWDQQFEYMSQAGLGWGPKGLLFRHLAHKLRIWDTRTAHGPHMMLANSSYVQARIRQVYGRDSRVVHPPVDLSGAVMQADKDDYYVVASFLVPYKRVDLVVEAFNAMPDRRLLVVGQGQEERKLRAMAGKNITFTGYVDRPRLIEIISNARAFVFAGCEDFGIILAEAQAFGTPLLAFGRGGARDIVREFDGPEAPTGVLFKEQTVDSLKQAVTTFEARRGEITPEACAANAARFSVDRFKRELREAFEDTCTLVRA